MSKCPDKPFIKAENNALSSLKNKGIIDDNYQILNQSEFDKINKSMFKHGLDTYGIQADWFIHTSNGKVVANKKAFEAVDFINNEKVDISDNNYIQQLKLARRLSDKDNTYFFEAARGRLQTMEDSGEVLYDPSSSYGIFSDPNNNIPKAGLTKILDEKKTYLKTAKSKLAQLKVDKQTYKSNVPKLTEITKQEGHLRDYINGNEAKGIVGLEKEIEDLKKIDTRSPELIEPYIRKDLDRLSYLVKSNDPIDIDEAEHIIEFAIKLGTFSPELEHPIYEREELFDKDGTFLLQPIMSDPFLEWKQEAEHYKRELKAQSIKLFEQNINTNRQVKQMYGREFTAQELTNNTWKDVHWIDMMVSSIEAGLLDGSPIIPQVIKIHTDNVFNTHKAWSSNIVEEINKLLPNVEEELRKLGKGWGINIKGKGVHGVYWGLFRQEYKDKNKTRELVDKYSPEYNDLAAKIVRNYRNAWFAAEQLQGQNKINKKIALYKERFNWINRNTIFVNPALLTDIKNNSEFTEFSDLFSTDNTAIQEHENKLKEQVGDIHYKEIIASQIKLLKEYKAQRQFEHDSILEKQNNGTELNEANKAALAIWEAKYSPFLAAKFMNTFAPKEVGSIKVYPQELKFSDFVPLKKIDGEDSGYYDTKYEQIENNPVLKEFYDVVHEALIGMRDRLDHEDQQKLTGTTLPLIAKHFMDLFIDENVSAFKAISPAFIRILDNIKNSFGIRKESQVTSADIDSITGKPKDTINREHTGNVDKIDNLFKVRATKVKSLYNKNRKSFIIGMNVQQIANLKLEKLTRNTIIKLTQDNKQEILDLLDDYINTTVAKQLEDSSIGDEIPIGQILYNSAQDEVVSDHTFDLPKIIKVYADSVAQYAARKELLPYIGLMKQYYQLLKKSLVTSDNKPIMKNGKPLMDGSRDNAMKQFDSWYRKVILNHYGLTNQYGVNDKKTLFDAEERKQIAEIDEAIELEKDLTKKNELIDMKARLGKNLAASSLVSNFLENVRFNGLGFNYGSGLNNFFGGQLDNSVADATGIYWPTDYIDTITPLDLEQGFVASLASERSIPQKVVKAKLIMERYDRLQDVSNVYQKPSMRGALSNLNVLSPYYQLKVGETANQTPVNIAIIRDTKITDKNGNISNVWDALEGVWDDVHHTWDLKLKEDFKTKENIDNWEYGEGDAFNDFQNRADATIKDIHGDFSNRGGMKAKDYQLGKAALGFKGWMAKKFFTNFAATQDRLDIGIKDYKGLQKGHTGVSAFTAGGITATIAFGPMVGLGVGAIAAFTARRINGRQSALSVLSELYHIHRLLTRKLLGFPLNPIARRITGKKLISEDWEKLFKKMESPTFTVGDFQRWKGNMEQMAIACAMLALIMLTKGFFWDDDDEQDSTRRKMHNLFANRFIMLANEITTYNNPISMGKNIVNAGVFRLAINISKVIYDLEVFLHNSHDDKIVSGIHSGESKLTNQSLKTFLPGIVSHNYLGFEAQMEQQFETTGVDKYYYGDEKKAKKELKYQKTIEIEKLENKIEKDKSLTREQKDHIEEGIEKSLRKEFKKGKYQTYKQKLEQHKLRQQQE